MSTQYSTANVAQHERIAYWREAANKEFARHRFSAGPSFRGDMRLDALGSLVFSQIDCGPCNVQRKVGPLSSCQSDNFVFTLQLAGKCVFFQDGREAQLSAGSMAMIDLQRPASLTYLTDMRCLTVSMPRKAVESRLANARALSARALPSSKPVAGLVAGFMTLLPERLGSLRDGGKKVAEHVLDLVTLALSLEAGEDGARLSSPKAVTLLRLKSGIEARMANPELKPATAAADAGISVRYANLLLSQEGYSIERYIQHRRLERCRGALEDPKQASRTIGELAFSWGFSDLSHFGRRFRAAYGFAPGDYRRRALEARSLDAQAQLAAE